MPRYRALINPNWTLMIRNGCLIWNRATAQRKPCKSAHGGNLIERLFHRRVAKSIPLLHAVHPKHRRQGIGRSAHSRLGIHGLNQLAHRIPGARPNSSRPRRSLAWSSCAWPRIPHRRNSIGSSHPPEIPIQIGPCQRLYVR